MKTLVSIVVMVCMFSFSFEGNAQRKVWTLWGSPCQKNKIKGSGDIVTKKVLTDDYDAINVTGPIDVYLEEGDEGNLRVTADDNLQEYLKITVQHETLILTMKKNICLSTKQGIRVAVPVKSISKVTSMGSGNIKAKHTITASTFYTSTKGSGDVDLVVKATKVVVDMIGSGNVTLSGYAADLDLNSEGSGDFRGSDLNFQNTNIDVRGSGDVALTKSSRANAELKANAFYASTEGSGNIVSDVSAAEVVVNVFGSGNVNLSGSTADLEVNLKGSGNFEGSDLDAQNTDVLVQGSGYADIVSNKKMHVRVMGSGDVFYRGNPEKIDINTSGSGDVHRRRKGK